MNKRIKRQRRKLYIRKKISGTSLMPRISVFRSNNNIYAQAIDDTNSLTLASASDLKSTENIAKVGSAVKVGQDLAKKLTEKNITKVVFDRSGYKYHGRVKALADSLRTEGIVL